MIRVVKLSHALPFIALSLFGIPSQATTLANFGISFCGPIVPGGGGASPPETCGETAVGGSAPGSALNFTFEGTQISPDFRSSTSGASAIEGGIGAVTGAAFAFADFGLLRVRARAVSPFPRGVYDPNPLVSARSIASVIDVGTITGPGSAGAPVLARGSLTVDSVLFGDGEGSVQLTIGSNLQGSLVNYQATLFGPVTSVSPTFDLSALSVGEELVISLTLRARAGAGATLFGALNESLADLSNSAHFNLDILTPGAAFNAASQHDYRSAVVPLPPAGWLLLTGLVAVFGRKSIR
jgi:hypothetical protein